MNRITKIALSLTFITLIAQHINAASYTDHAKKAARIALHALKIGVGVYFSQKAKAQLPKTLQLLKLTGYLLPKEKDDAKKMGIAMFAGSFLLFNGITGLKKEICPNFKPIEWIKSKFSKKTEQTV